MSATIRRCRFAGPAIALAVTAVGTLGIDAAFGQDVPVTVQSPAVVATVNDRVITLQELERALAPQLAKLQEQRYQLLESKLEAMIDDHLLAREAERRGVTVEALLRTEVSAKVPGVGEAEIGAFITENRSRLRGDGPELRARVREYLATQKESEQRRTFLAGLRQRARVATFLEEPEPIRIQVKVDGAFVKGPQDAPVTIVEFSDFHCPFCRGAVATVKEVLRQFPVQVKWVFRDFPLPSLHPQAFKAAEAARCAGEQGKFWEYHDILFDSQDQTTTADFKRFAEQLKLDGARFAGCLDSGKYRAAVEADMKDGTQLGVTGTPTFFINGRMLVGAQPLEQFRKVIERELKRQPK
jgi:protein-disulfide isomerase